MNPVHNKTAYYRWKILSNRKRIAWLNSYGPNCRDRFHLKWTVSIDRYMGFKWKGLLVTSQFFSIKLGHACVILQWRICIGIASKKLHLGCLHRFCSVRSDGLLMVPLLSMTFYTLEGYLLLWLLAMFRRCIILFTRITSQKLYITLKKTFLILNQNLKGTYLPM